jgi:ferrous iron transport protein B
MQKEISPTLDTKPTIILVGNPNVGKSVVFSYLTGRYATVSNYPGTTVEISRGKSLLEKARNVIDTPGVNSLHPSSVDERVTRDILISDFPRTVLQVADAKNLRRSLTITTQLAEMGLPVILELNMMDEAKRRRIRVSGDALAQRIGVPVVETIATEKKGFKRLSTTLSEEGRVPNVHVQYPTEIERGIARIAEIIAEVTISKRAVSLMFLSNPTEAYEAFEARIGEEYARRAKSIAEEIQSKFSNPLSYIIGVSRSKVVSDLLDAVYDRGPAELGVKAETGLRQKSIGLAAAFTLLSAVLYGVAGVDNLTAWGLHPLLLHLIGLLVLFAAVPYSFLGKLTTHQILGVVFLAEVLYVMYKFVGVFGAGTLVDLIETNIFGKWVVPYVTIGLDKIVPVAFVHDLFVGEYGLISMGLTYSIFAFGILEDSGYLPRLSVIADRGMRRIGLNGKAVLPMVLGLGCDTMATLTTRILDSKKERIIATLLLALGVPCSAQLGVIMAMAAGSSVACMFTVFFVIVLQLVLVGTLSNRLIRGRTSDFIVELPPLRVPQLGNIMMKTRHRIEWFLKEAVPLFLIGTLVLFILQKLGALTTMERLAKPVIAGMLDLPGESTVAFIVGFFRRDYGAAGLFDLFSDGLLNHNQVAVSMVVITLFVPCIANFLVMIKERGLMIALAMVAFILPYAILVGTVLNLFLNLTGIRL